MGSPLDEAADAAGSAAHADVASALHLRHVVPPNSMVSLNEPITVDEVTQVLQLLPPGKSADVQRMTCELLRLAVVRIPTAAPDSPDAEYICKQLATCLTHIFRICQHVAVCRL
jgi:hypothetical protein